MGRDMEQLLSHLKGGEGRAERVVGGPNVNSSVLVGDSFLAPPFVNCDQYIPWFSIVISQSKWTTINHLISNRIFKIF